VDLATTDNLDGVVTLHLSEIEALHSGQMLVVRPKIRLDTRSSDVTEAPQRNWFWSEVLKHTPVYLEVIVAALLLNLFTIASSIFTMQVYDRVVPNKAESTLIVLVIGVMLIYVLDFLLRTLRAMFLDRAGKILDRTFCRSRWRPDRNRRAPSPAMSSNTRHCAIFSHRHRFPPLLTCRSFLFSWALFT